MLILGVSNLKPSIALPSCGSNTACELSSDVHVGINALLVTSLLHTRPSAGLQYRVLEACLVRAHPFCSQVCLAFNMALSWAV